MGGAVGGGNPTCCVRKKERKVRYQMHRFRKIEERNCVLRWMHPQGNPVKKYEEGSDCIGNTDCSREIRGKPEGF
jgi:hypothetical protein